MVSDPPGLTPERPAHGVRPGGSDTSARFYSAGVWHDAPVHTRDTLGIGARLTGPALVIEPHQTVVIEPGWALEVTAQNDLVLQRVEKRSAERLSAKADPVLLEVFNNLFMSIAEQMGEALRNTSQSVNIKERLDFSCAIFDGKALTGAVYDLSRTGAQLVLESDEMPRMPLVGSPVSLKIAFRRTKLDCEAEVRGLTTINGSQGKRLVLGLQFVALEDTASDQLERMIREAAEEFEMTRQR